MASHFTVFEFSHISVFWCLFLKLTRWQNVCLLIEIKINRSQHANQRSVLISVDHLGLICLSRSRKFQCIIQPNSKNMPTWNYELLTTQKRVFCDFILILMSKLNFSYFILMFTGIAMTHWYCYVYLPDQPATHASRRLAFWPAELKYLYKILW